MVSVILSGGPLGGQLYTGAAEQPVLRTPEDEVLVYRVLAEEGVAVYLGIDGQLPVETPVQAEPVVATVQPVVVEPVLEEEPIVASETLAPQEISEPQRGFFARLFGA